MKVIIDRTSGYKNKKEPCAGVHKEYLIYLDRRNVKSLAEARKREWFSEWWTGGVNHREEEGHVVCERKRPVPEWVLDIHSLEELCALAQLEGKIILLPCDWYKDIQWAVEIYDDYRE